MKITPEEVLNAYKETGLKPVIGEWLNQEAGCACALGVLSKKHAVGVDPSKIDDWATLQYGEDWAIGFVTGFDGDKPSNFWSSSSSLQAEYLDGYANGVAVRKAVFAEAGSV